MQVETLLCNPSDYNWVRSLTRILTYTSTCSDSRGSTSL